MKIDDNLKNKINDIYNTYEELESSVAKIDYSSSSTDDYKELFRSYNKYKNIIELYEQLQNILEEYNIAKEFVNTDKSFIEECDSLQKKFLDLSNTIKQFLKKEDPYDDRNVILEIKSGEGGKESDLFVADLFKMYIKYIESVGWKYSILDIDGDASNGYKNINLLVYCGSKDPTPWQHLKYEGGVHRVQRVPVTESQGRIHTSAAAVYIIPEAKDVEVVLDSNDLRIDVYRSSGPGGQSVNTTDSAVRITHIPTNIVVSCQNEKSQRQNKEVAMRILQSRLTALEEEKANKDIVDARKQQVRTVDRSEKIRTYNFHENRITDHRSGYKAYNLNFVLNGELEPVILSCINYFQNLEDA